MTIKNALIVDDSKSARIMLQRLLEKMNLNAQAVESAEEALRYLEDQHPDIIFMDHMMPGMDGLEATQTITSNPKTENIPTIMYTSKESDGYNTLAMSHGASGVLPKPANQQAIMAVIHSLESTAANDVSDDKIKNINTDQISIEAIDKMIKQRLDSSVLSAKAEITAGLDGVIHQVLQTQQERLTIAERNLKQHIKPLQLQLSDLDNNNILLKRLQPQLQKQMMVIADKISRQKVDALNKEHLLKIKEITTLQNNFFIEISNKSRLAMIKSMIGGALLGATIAIVAQFII
ncbi:MAG: CheY-like chemotaxis protein [Oleispira sp.]|jgi:CheY-like chemotaxis protein